MKKESFVFIANGFEEIEAMSVIDILRRAEMPVKTISVSSSLQVKGAHGIIVTADALFDNTLFTNPEWLILPGGMPGATNLYEFDQLAGLLKREAGSPNGAKIAAICASPAVVLGQLGLLNNRHATCYPGFENLCHGAKMVDSPVVISNDMVLGSGPAAATNWALAIVAVSLGRDVADHVANGMLLYERFDGDIDNFFG